MPEVVEIFLTARFLENELKNKTLTYVNIEGGRYSRHTMKGLSYFKRHLPMKIDKICSKGKFLWFELSNDDNNFYILNTFGLKGEWGFTKKKHSGVRFKIKNHDDLFFTDSRNFGTIEMTSNKKKLDDKLNSIADDFLQKTFTEKEFRNRIEKYIFSNNGTMSLQRGNKQIIKVLMEQKSNIGIGSGLGNYLAVEILYLAGISPHKKMVEIYKDQKLANKLSKKIKYVTKLSYMTADIGYLGNLDPKMKIFVKKLRKDVIYDTNHKYNFHPDINIKKDKFKFNVYRQKTDPKGYKVIGDKIIKGRTTYWVPSLQE